MPALAEVPVEGEAATFVTLRKRLLRTSTPVSKTVPQRRNCPKRPWLPKGASSSQVIFSRHPCLPSSPQGNHVQPDETLPLTGERCQGDSGHSRSCQPSGISLQLSTTPPCTCLLHGTPDGGFKQFVDQGLVRLALPRRQPA